MRLLFRFVVLFSSDFSFLFFVLYIQYVGFCWQQKGRGLKPRHTRRKKGIPTAHPSDVSEGAVLLAYIYSIPDFSAGANFYRIFFAGDGRAAGFCIAG